MNIKINEDKFWKSHYVYPNCKNPKSIQEMGLYNPTMAISTGFTVGLNVNDYF
jgi:hypothetical protein